MIRQLRAYRLKGELFAVYCEFVCSHEEFANINGLQGTRGPPNPARARVAIVLHERRDGRSPRFSCRNACEEITILRANPPKEFRLG